MVLAGIEDVTFWIVNYRFWEGPAQENKAIRHQSEAKEVNLTYLWSRALTTTSRDGYSDAAPPSASNGWSALH